MKIDPDDPKLTAFALDELSGDDASAMSEAVANSPEAQASVHGTRELAGWLRAQFRDELDEAAAKPLNILPLPSARSFWSDAQWLSIGVAAALAICAVIAAVLFSNGRSSANIRVAKARAEVQMEFVAEPSSALDGQADASANENDQRDENPFVLAAAHPFSTFPIAVGTASYAKVKSSIERGELPPKDSIRIEELINYFSFEEPPPASEGAFSITLEVAGCPWAVEHRLVRIGLQARAGEIEKNLSAQVEFNPARVGSYRLLGFENRNPGAVRPNETKNGDFPGGQRVTALYEVIPTAPTTSSEKMLAVNLGSESPEAHALIDIGTSFAAASDDLKFAAAVAEFGMILRKSAHKGDGTFAKVVEWARAGRGRDLTGDRGEFVGLVQMAERIPL